MARDRFQCVPTNHCNAGACIRADKLYKILSDIAPHSTYTHYITMFADVEAVEAAAACEQQRKRQIHSLYLWRPISRILIQLDI